MKTNGGKSECRMSNGERNSKAQRRDRTHRPQLRISGFGLHSSFVIRHSSFAVSALLLALSTVGNASAATRSSTSYSVPADAQDAGGRRTTSANYSNSGSVGGVAGLGTVAAPVETAKHGYIGQLYDVKTFQLSASPTNVNEGATRQLAASATLDDNTKLNPAATTVAWSVLSGPIHSISAGGLALAPKVYQDTLASVRGGYGGQLATLALNVLNTGNDDFGLYAGDGLDDTWQVQYFGLNNSNAAPLADPDGDGQNNRFEFTAGTNPTNAQSHFSLRIEAVPGRPFYKYIIFSPVLPPRDYAVIASPDLTPGSFQKLGNFDVSDAGVERTVTDLDATATNKFYQVFITKP